MFGERSNGGDTPVPIEKPTQGTLQVMAREAVEARGMVEAAKAFPRETASAFLALKHSCERIGFADRASYSFPRGGNRISGPSVALAREAARCWGNVTYGVRIIEDTDEHVHLQGWAWDMETNTRVTAEDKFRKLIQRKDKKTGETLWVKPDERDLRELINRRGALAVRNAILQVLPRDLIDDALDRAEYTIVADSQGNLKENRQATIKKLVEAFDEFGVSPKMLEERLGHGLDEIDGEELADLRQIYRSLKDGNTRRGDHFDLRGNGKAASEAADEITQKVKGKRGKKKAPEPESPAEDEQEEPEGGPIEEVQCPMCEGRCVDDDGVACEACEGRGEVPA